jgi:hypothetical protein
MGVQKQMISLLLVFLWSCCYVWKSSIATVLLDPASNRITHQKMKEQMVLSVDNEQVLVRDIVYDLSVQYSIPVNYVGLMLTNVTIQLQISVQSNNQSLWVYQPPPVNLTLPSFLIDESQLPQEVINLALDAFSKGLYHRIHTYTATLLSHGTHRLLKKRLKLSS